MTDAHLDVLEALALAATPGPWATRPYDLRDWTTGKCVNTDVALGLDHPIRGVARPTGNDGYSWITTACERNAAYIAAANPDTLRALVLALREAREERDQLERDRATVARETYENLMALKEAHAQELKEAREERDTLRKRLDELYSLAEGAKP